MINRKWLMFIILSAALNVAFVATWAFHALPERIKSDPAEPTEIDACEGMRRMHNRLGAGPEQTRRMEMRMDRFNEKRHEISEGMRDLQAELIDLIAAEETDMQAIEDVQERMLDHHRKMQRLVISNLLAEKEDLTPEQREAFFRMLRMRSPGQGGAMHGRIEGQPDDRPRGGPGRGREEHTNQEDVR